MSKFDLKPIEEDALKEICNVGVAHAAGELSKMLGLEVELDVPELFFGEEQEPLPLPFKKGESDEQQIYIVHKVSGLAVTGHLFYFISNLSAVNLILALQDKEESSVQSLNRDDMNTLKQIGGVLGDSFLNAFSSELGMKVTSFLGTIHEGSITQALKKVAGAGVGVGSLLSIVVHMRVDVKKISCLLVLALNKNGTQQLLGQLRELLPKS